ncbi:hypothetical protein COCC4DRAFT_71063 [Bipolaris maydis ATCC 48331]|uniref:S-adenosyl-L-methionine-dependent methyltransferase n=2 Tax=Cochliobolus heterostrophus TaxID=5016 RepID=M2U0S2_COCH5|nr:uncharacterized protein COCC4DRAFT_71063 [Bipolaris maydis ATCC 48331]EMD87661.1 hypothetical protein COCHEDRAFT_128103 [Bipolaris maydis C5]KAJ5023079.1 S-adenosyl-L-methionine-dependent methyltransferase [Bipolaris maydis]ENI06860.1 hypothetical protein COCC4DRAFT_71063 [Bipolaris maydis ATCC 48331]KAJ5056175.1 S-adenosyl-L-methionine-dependent methyltransferase [Bipolaris maydis]KAJ6193921.1 S-adenosyl-L-methionine-dependent methyltransferase [Bipolaris maydis]
MPRISTSLIRKARAIDPLLPALLAPCRELQAAQNELRWLREHVEEVGQTRRARPDKWAKRALLRQLVHERSRGKPLQYILGTEHFGDLEIRCKPGVLIPRPDTAASVTHFVSLLRNAKNLPPELRLLDLCTGTGCIPLLFQHELLSARSDINLRLLGVDVCDKAISLAKHNLQRLFKDRQLNANGQVHFLKADILIEPFADDYGQVLPLKTALNYSTQPVYWDIVISNPPYISPSAFWKTTTRSVRNFEPKLALVPPSKDKQTDTQQGDMFYPRLLNVARDVEAKVVLLEVADIEQALRVARVARDLEIFDGIEIWREDPNAPTTETSKDGFDIIGQGNARTVLCWQGQGACWLGKTTAISAAPTAEGASRFFRNTPATSANSTEACSPKVDTYDLKPQFDLNFFWQQNHQSTSRLGNRAFKMDWMRDRYLVQKKP